MTTTNIIPDGLVLQSNTAVTGAASIVAALTDGSDTSYVTVGTPTTQGTFQVTNSTFTLPAGAVVIAITVKYRAVGLTFPVVPYIGNTYSAVSQPTLTASLADYTEVWPPLGSGTHLANQTDLDAWSLYVTTASPYSNHDWRIASLSTDVQYALKPTTAVTAPSGTVTTTTAPTCIWTHTINSDGSTQTAYQVRVFTAAQYGAGGFDPATSTAAFDTGIVSSAATSVVLPLSNSTTYRAYVRTAQTTLGSLQWADYAFSGFSISLTTADITSVVATASSANGRNGLVITRNGATPAWTSVEVQRSIDAGVTWSYVRGYTRFAVSTSPITVTDYESPPGVAAVYRARATYQLAGLDIASSWVSSASVTWTSVSDYWLKDLRVPTRNLTVRIRALDTLHRARRQGRFAVLGRADPVVVSDVRSLSSGTLVLRTLTDADSVALNLLLSTDIVLLQAPTGLAPGSMYLAVGDVDEVRAVADYGLATARFWSIDFVEVAVPADTGLG